MAKVKKSEIPTATAQSSLYYSLHSLLETIRVIKTYEDPLCTLLHAIHTAGNPSHEEEQELYALLDEMPSESYALELHGLRAALFDGTRGPAESASALAKTKLSGDPTKHPETAKDRLAQVSSVRQRR